MADPDDDGGLQFWQQAGQHQQDEHEHEQQQTNEPRDDARTTGETE